MTRPLIFAVSVLLLSCCGHVCALLSVYDKIYVTVGGVVPCFRLTNATHQIGCSASYSYTRGVLFHVSSADSLQWLVSRGTHSPYLALLNPEDFTHENVTLLRSSSRVSGIIVRFDGASDSIPSDLERFSPERQCPSVNYGVGSCDTTNPWNPDGNELSFSDFGDFPVFAVDTENFNLMLNCTVDYNSGADGGISDYPLCAAEMTADMKVVRDTPTCYRRERLQQSLEYILTEDKGLCDPLGDSNVWGTLFPLTASQDSDVILLSTKLDSNAFFPGLAFGANNEVAGIATLLAVVEQLGRLKQNGLLRGTQRPIMYVFFQGESWDYIGSSRMVWDMQRSTFPLSSDEVLPHLSLSSIGDYLELNQLGRAEGRTFFLHSCSQQSPLVNQLNATAQNYSVSLQTSTGSCEGQECCRLPPSSLSQFVRESGAFPGTVLADFDARFEYSFYGSRWDQEAVFSEGDSSELDRTVETLTTLATVIANAVLSLSGPTWAEEVEESERTVSASNDTVRAVLDCFLVNSSCESFRTVLHPALFCQLDRELDGEPFGRYVSVNTQTNHETTLIFQFLAYYTGTNVTNATGDCQECLNIIRNGASDAYNITWMQGPGGREGDCHSNTQMQGQDCWCLNSTTYYHTAVSPAFEMEDYESRKYSTWAESRWTVISVRMYLVTYILQEVAFLLCGLVMTAIALLVAVQGSRKGRKLFRAEEL